MKTTLLTLFVLTLFVNIASAQSGVNNHKQTDQNGNPLKVAVDTTYKHVKDSIAISSELQKDIKALNEAMKPYEDIVREYNRMAGLRTNIYQTLIKAKGYKVENLVGQPVITDDWIKFLLALPKVK